MTLEEEITKLDLIASDAFEGGDANEFKQLAEWLRELQKYREMLKNEPQIRKDVQMYMIREMIQNDTIRSNK